jgi:hypothetical protein
VPNCRKRLPERAYLSTRAARIGYGSEVIATVIQLARPRFAFFGHYSGEGSRIDGDLGEAEVYYLGGFVLGGRDGHAEFGSVGALTWDSDTGEFTFLDPDWLRSFTRHNWKSR